MTSARYARQGLTRRAHDSLEKPPDMQETGSLPPSSSRSTGTHLHGSWWTHRSLMQATGTPPPCAGGRKEGEITGGQAGSPGRWQLPLCDQCGMARPPCRRCCRCSCCWQPQPSVPSCPTRPSPRPASCMRWSGGRGPGTSPGTRHRTGRR